jgi:hypothetical protein
MLVQATYGRERLEAGDRILERPRGVARIDVDADVVGAGRFDESGQLPRLHVAGVVLDGDLDAGRERVGAHRLADLDGVLDVRLDAALRAAILLAAEVAPDHRRADDLRHADAVLQLLDGGAGLGVERTRRRADARHAEVERQPALSPPARAGP